MNTTPAEPPDWLPVGALCVTQVISWGTLYYAFSLFLAPIGASRGWAQAEMVGAFSLSLLMSGLCAYPAGSLIQRFGGRWVMSAGSLLAALALGLVANAPSLAVFYLAWAIGGLAGALTLYEAAFSVLAATRHRDYRRAVTTVTLAGGLASTVFWPLTERLIFWLGWPQTALVYSGLHLLVCLPLHAWGLRDPASPVEQTLPAKGGPDTFASLLRQPSFQLLAGSFVCNSIVFAVVSVHLIPLLQASGASAQQAAWMSAVAGPMQVLARFVEFRFGDRWRAGQTGVAALAMLIPALLGLSFSAAPLRLLAVALYGLSNGAMTIVRSLTIVEIFGRTRYARVSGAIAAPALVARAAGPFLASLVLLQGSGYAGLLILLAMLGVLSLVLFLRAHRDPTKK